MNLGLMSYRLLKMIENNILLFKMTQYDEPHCDLSIYYWSSNYSSVIDMNKECFQTIWS